MLFSNFLVFSPSIPLSLRTTHTDTPWHTKTWRLTHTHVVFLRVAAVCWPRGTRDSCARAEVGRAVSVRGMTLRHTSATLWWSLKLKIKLRCRNTKTSWKPYSYDLMIFLQSSTILHTLLLIKTMEWVGKSRYYHIFLYKDIKKCSKCSAWFQGEQEDVKDPSNVSVFLTPTQHTTTTFNVKIISWKYFYFFQATAMFRRFESSRWNLITYEWK